MLCGAGRRLARQPTITEAVAVVVLWPLIWMASRCPCLVTLTFGGHRPAVSRPGPGFPPGTPSQPRGAFAAGRRKKWAGSVPLAGRDVNFAGWLEVGSAGRFRQSCPRPSAAQERSRHRCLRPCESPLVTKVHSKVLVTSVMMITLMAAKL